MEKIVCEHCGSEYWLSETKLPVRDKDSIDCEVCGEELHSWNESACYSAKLIKAAEWPKKASS